MAGTGLFVFEFSLAKRRLRVKAEKTSISPESALVEICAI
jgi:hypothetical protein